MEKAVTGLTSGFSQFEVRWSYFQAQNNRKTLIFSMVYEITPKRSLAIGKMEARKIKRRFFVKKLCSILMIFFVRVK